MCNLTLQLRLRLRLQRNDGGRNTHTAEAEAAEREACSCRPRHRTAATGARAARRLRAMRGRGRRRLGCEWHGRAHEAQAEERLTGLGHAGLERVRGGRGSAVARARAHACARAERRLLLRPRRGGAGPAAERKRLQQA